MAKNYPVRGQRRLTTWRTVERRPELRRAVQTYGGRELRRLLPGLARDVSRVSRPGAK